MGRSVKWVERRSGSMEGERREMVKGICFTSAAI